MALLANSLNPPTPISKDWFRHDWESGIAPIKAAMKELKEIGNGTVPAETTAAASIASVGLIGAGVVTAGVIDIGLIDAALTLGVSAAAVGWSMEVLTKTAGVYLGTSEVNEPGGQLLGSNSSNPEES
eukprot:CAMPEP_0184306482 /NCGR_PEP_ID=MMETSP1049-20130417/15473_1 /TAXON_ID=77928 /ORGANISM="Proteomonas sulcata, Strain CCMP704" /LENGTH=127 /DNA_ID=CAMNT_0026618759 /DNA_START=101 /DNA_END=484 /DNA_ORIENTATION=+